MRRRLYNASMNNIWKAIFAPILFCCAVTAALPERGEDEKGEAISMSTDAKIPGGVTLSTDRAKYRFGETIRYVLSNNGDRSIYLDSVICPRELASGVRPPVIGVLRKKGKEVESYMIGAPKKCGLTDDISSVYQIKPGDQLTGRWDGKEFFADKNRADAAGIFILEIDYSHNFESGEPVGDLGVAIPSTGIVEPIFHLESASFQID